MAIKRQTVRTRIVSDKGHVLSPITLEQGEKVLFTGILTADIGSLTLAAPTLTLYDSAGAAVTNFNGIAVTGYDSGAGNPRHFWYLLDTSVLSAGNYVLTFSVPYTNSIDAFAHQVKPQVRITLENPGL